MMRAGIHCQAHLLNVFFPSDSVWKFSVDNVVWWQCFNGTEVLSLGFQLGLCYMSSCYNFLPQHKDMQIGPGASSNAVHTWVRVRLSVSGCQSCDKPVTWLSTPPKQPLSAGMALSPHHPAKEKQWLMIHGWIQWCSCGDDLETQWNWSRLLGLIGSGGMKLCLLSVLLLCLAAVSYAGSPFLLYFVALSVSAFALNCACCSNMLPGCRSMIWVCVWWFSEILFNSPVFFF